MPTAAYKRWSHSSDTALLLLEGVALDLFSALESLELLAQQWRSESLNPVIVQALSTSSIVHYARPFASGVRQSIRIDKDFSLSQEELALHEKVLAIRNKHVAHPVNEFETHTLFVAYHVEAPEPVATGVSTGSVVLGSLAPEEIEPFMALCRKLLDQVQLKRQAESMRLLELAKQLTPSEIRALPEGPVQASDNPWRVRRRT